jgi:hypothetical protein
MGDVAVNALSRIVIVLALMALAPGMPFASAREALKPTDAVKLLARSVEADAKCRHLDADEHQKLADFVARAEVAAARLSGVAATQAARQAGTREGAAMACDGASRDLVTATLEAARLADRQARGLSPAPKPQHQAAGTRQAPASDEEALKLGGDADGLDGYVRHAAAYYVERRCRYLPARDTMAFWNVIVERHYAMIDRFGGAAVTEAKAKAEAAGAGPCNAEAASLVRAAWGDLQRLR